MHLKTEDGEYKAGGDCGRARGVESTDAGAELLAMHVTEITDSSSEVEKRRSLRPIAFCAVAFATVSVLACSITLPIVYSHIQSVNAFMTNEVDFCKVSDEH